MGRRKKLINHTDIPQYEIEKIARCILPDILAYYDSEEGQREFAEWKARREQTQTQDNDTLNISGNGHDRCPLHRSKPTGQKGR